MVSKFVAGIKGEAQVPGFRISEGSRGQKDSHPDQEVALQGQLQHREPASGRQTTKRIVK